MALVNPVPKWKGYEPVLSNGVVLYPNAGQFFMPAGVLAMSMGDGNILATSPNVIIEYPAFQIRSVYYELTGIRVKPGPVLRGEPVGTIAADRGLPLEFRRGDGSRVDPATVLKGLPVLRDPRQTTIFAIASFIGAGLLGLYIYRARQE